MTDTDRAFHLLPKEKRQPYVDAIIGYFHTERGEKIGQVAAEEVLDFFLEHIAPAVYNHALDDALVSVRDNLDEIAFKFGELRR